MFGCSYVRIQTQDFSFFSKIFHDTSRIGPRGRWGGWAENGEERFSCRLRIYEAKGLREWIPALSHLLLREELEDH